MRNAVPHSGRARSLSVAVGAACGLLLACGSSTGSGLFGGSAGAVAASGMAGASVLTSGGAAGSLGVGGLPSSGGNASSSGGTATSGGGSNAGGAATGIAGGGSQATGGNSTGGQATGGNATGGKGTGGKATDGKATGGGDGLGGATVGGVANGGQSAAGISAGGNAAGGGATGGSAGNGGGNCTVSAEQCDGIDNDCDASVDEDGCPDQCTGFELNGQGYMVCSAGRDAAMAASVCEAQGLRLAWLESAEENAALLQTISDISQSSGRDGRILEVYIGASDSEQETHWSWLGGTDFWVGGARGEPVDNAYTNWAQGRPNGAIDDLLGEEDCAVLVIDQDDDGQPGEWNDVACANDYGVLCEQP